MRKLLNINIIFLLFHFLLVSSLLVLFDYYIFGILLSYLRMEYLLLGIALSSGLFTLITLNSITDLIRMIKHNTMQSKQPYRNFTLLLVTIFLGILLIIPGFISTGVALILYLPPIRRMLAYIVFRLSRKQIISLFALFLYEQLPGKGLGSSGKK